MFKAGLIEKAGWKEAGRQRHELFKSKFPNVKNALTFDKMPGCEYYCENEQVHIFTNNFNIFIMNYFINYFISYFPNYKLFSRFPTVHVRV